jgi:CelD/BcsL family acetyltransferase involved in cellulose biosynthesis
MSPEWLQAYIDHYGRRHRPLCLEVREGPDLVGVAPLMVSRIRGLKTLTFLGQPVNGTNAILSLPAYEAEVGISVWAFLNRHWLWDMCELAGRPDGVHAQAPSDGASLRTRIEPLPDGSELPLPSTAEEYLETLSRKRRFQARYYWDRLQREHGATFRVLESPDDLRGEIERFIAARKQAYADRPGYLSRLQRTAAYDRFLADATIRAATSGGTALFQLVIDGSPCASILCYRVAQGFTVYQRTYDSRVGSLSPGSVLDVLLVRWAINRGDAVLDLGPGAMEYKSRLGSTPYPRVLVTATRASMRGRVSGGTRDAALYALAQQRRVVRLFSRVRRKPS